MALGCGCRRRSNTRKANTNARHLRRYPDHALERDDAALERAVRACHDANGGVAGGGGGGGKADAGKGSAGRRRDRFFDDFCGVGEDASAPSDYPRGIRGGAATRPRTIASRDCPVRDRRGRSPREIVLSRPFERRSAPDHGAAATPSSAGVVAFSGAGNALQPEVDPELAAAAAADPELAAAIAASLSEAKRAAPPKSAAEEQAEMRAKRLARFG